MSLERPAQATFCWADVATHDVARLKTFYAAVFDWSFEDVPLDDGDMYTLCLASGRRVCGLRERSGETFVPQWISYLHTDDVDTTAGEAVKLGCEIIAQPGNLSSLARVALVKDPSLAVVGLWQPNDLRGPGSGGLHTICWTELRTRDPGAASRFYSELLRWKPRLSTEGMEYTDFVLAEAPVCGMLPMPADIPMFVPAHWLPYVAVTSVDAAVERAKAAGGKLMAPSMDIPGVGRMAAIGDATGTVFAVVEQDRRVRQVSRR